MFSYRRGAVYVSMLASLARLFFCAGDVYAHPLDLAVVSLHITGDSLDGTISLSPELRVSAQSGQNPNVAGIIGRLSLDEPETACQMTLHEPRLIDQSLVYTFNGNCPLGSKQGNSLSIERDLSALAGLPAEYMTMYLIEDRGARYTARLPLGTPRATVVFEVDSSFMTMVTFGIEHIGAAPNEWWRAGRFSLPEGLDHILFVFILTLCSPSLYTLLLSVTGFTLGHSITLTLITFYGIPAPPQIIEPAIAASIAIMALHGLRVTSPSRGPWLLASFFGLIHGCGFASALIERQVSGSALIYSVLGFNLGVEIGQIILVAIFCLGLTILNKRGLGKQARTPLLLAAFAISCYWCVERLGILAGW